MNERLFNSDMDHVVAKQNRARTLKAINLIDATDYVRRSEIAAYELWVSVELITHAPRARGIALPALREFVL